MVNTHIYSVVYMPHDEPVSTLRFSGDFQQPRRNNLQGHLRTYQALSYAGAWTGNRMCQQLAWCSTRTRVHAGYQQREQQCDKTEIVTCENLKSICDAVVTGRRLEVMVALFFFLW